MIGFRIKRTLKMGLKSLWLHKLRSSLTVLGITLGVCSVIAMLAIGEGGSYEAQQQIKQLGSHNIIIQTVKPPESAQGGSTTSRVIDYGLKYLDAERIHATVPNVKVLVQARKVRQTVFHGVHRIDTNLVGTMPWYSAVTNATVSQGRFFNPFDMHGRKNVCVLGSQAARELFPMGGAVNSIIRAENKRYRVVGVLGSLNRGKAGEKEIEGNPDYDVYIPFTTMYAQFGETIVSRTTGSMSAEKVQLHEIIVQANELDRVMSVGRVIEQILKTNHSAQDYQVIVPLRLLEQARRTQRIFSIVLGSIAAISLLVGGIGIMNITLASVMERTREIGIRRAMGAKKKHIIEQFLTETVILSLFGGALGILLGMLAPYAVTRLFGMATLVTAWAVVLAFSISAATGLIFGIYPAYRAAAMDPIEALRHE